MKSFPNEIPPAIEKIVSPFAQSEVSISGERESRSRLALIVRLGLVLLVGGAAVGTLTMRYINDPYRTLENFPVAKYLGGYLGLCAGNQAALLFVSAQRRPIVS